MASHNQTGRTGEAMAAKHLIEKGFAILHQNWRHSHWEVDIIASKDNILHFVEVKARRTKSFTRRGCYKKGKSHQASKNTCIKIPDGKNTVRCPLH
jgi:Holliday junction resolvase-like predicted endonuclease